MSIPESFPCNLLPLSPIEAIESLHLGVGAAVTFHRKVHRYKPDREWQDLGAIMLSELRTKWHLIEEHLRIDAYFSVSSTYEQKRFTRICKVTGLPVYSRKAERLRWLNCVLLDVDIYKVRDACSFAETIEILARELACNDLPQPSFLCSSGRGIWGLWLLRDHSNPTPVPAYPERLDIYERVNKALVKRLAHLGADPNAVDPSRVMRVPGSINTDAAPQNGRVQFFKWSNDFHTLPALADLLGVTSYKVRLPGENAKPKNEARVNAGLMRWRKPLEGFCRLWNMRGHFRKGTRRYAVWIYALLLRRNRTPEADILRQCLRLAESCRPALTRRDVQRCISSSSMAARKDFRESISNARIARMLKVTTHEQVQLPDWLKPKGEKKSVEIACRRAVIMHELQLAGRWSSNREKWIRTRDMAHLLADKHGIKRKDGMPLSHVTLAKDYRLLYQSHFAKTEAVNSSVLVDTPLSLCTSTKNLTVDLDCKRVPESRTIRNWERFRLETRQPSANAVGAL